MKYRQILYILLACFLMVQQLEAKRQKKIARIAVADSVTKTFSQDVYPKIFKKKSQLFVARQQDLSLFLYDKKVYMEIPTKNFGKEYLLSSTITKANLPILVGNQANASKRFVVEQNDTLMTFRCPKEVYRTSLGDSDMVKALDLADKGAIFRTTSILSWNQDSTAVLVEVTDFFNASNKEVFDLKGTSYDLGTSITGCSVEKSLSFWDDVQAFKRCVCVNQSVTGSLSLGGSLIGELSDKPSLQASLQTLVTLLPFGDNMMKPREANASVGTKCVKYKDFRNIESVKDGYYATRRRFMVGDTITFYVDSLLSTTWVKAIHKAAEGWNDAFAKANLGRPIRLASFPKDSSFNAYDPMENVIVLNNSGSQFVSFDLPVDPRTGEIFSSHIQIPRCLADDVRRYGVCKMAEVDERYRKYDLPDDLLCEILQAKMLSAFGYSLGLSANLAGSAAYSVAQLRSPTFTKQNGISASVMDGQIYNYVTMPGDKEKGVVLTYNHPGIYDDFVIKYLYTPEVSDETLTGWVSSHVGDARYFCGKRNLKYASDPRCQSFDMSNNPFLAAKNMMHHYKYLATHAPEWYNYSDLPDTYRQLFPEFVINDYFSLLQTLTPFIGGVYLNEYVDGKTVEVTRSVPKDLQRKAVKELFYELNDVSWLDANPAYFQSAGPSANVGWWVRHQEFMLKLSLLYRLPNMDMSIEHSDNPYTQDDLIDDVINFCFRSVKVGKAPSSGEIYDMYALVSYLTSSSVVLNDIAKAKLIRGEAFAQESAIEPASEVKYAHITDLGPLILQKLKKIRTLLMRAKSLSRSELEKFKIDCSILVVDRVLVRNHTLS